MNARPQPAVGGEPPLRFLTVCTHNRARSVAMTELLRVELRQQGVPADVASAGFMPPGERATHQMVTSLAERGIDASPHRSTVIDATAVAEADLILTAERAHVIRISEDDSSVFARTFTLPEFVQMAEAFGPRRNWPIDRWVGALSVARTHGTFLHGGAAQIADPTGLSHAAHLATVQEIADLCHRLVALL